MLKSSMYYISTNKCITSMFIIFKQISHDYYYQNMAWGVCDGLYKFVGYDGRGKLDAYEGSKVSTLQDTNKKLWERSCHDL